MVDFNECNTCRNSTCRTNDRLEQMPKSIVEQRRCPGKVVNPSGFKLGILALAHPQSLNDALSQFGWGTGILKLVL